MTDSANSARGPSGAGLDKDPAHIAGMFNAIAFRYDTLNRLLSAGLDQRWRARAVRALGLTGTELVLDLCTGTADLALAEVRPPLPRARRVVGIDFASEMLRLARAKIRRAALEDAVSLVRGDALRVPLASASVDAVTIAFGIRNVLDPEAACAEMRRVLKPGGRVAILEFGIPRAPLLRRAYLWYFGRVLPWIGRRISRHRDAYTYLPASVTAFFPSGEFVELLHAAGFSQVRADPLAFGIVYLYTAVKA